MTHISLKSVCFFIVLFIACSAYGKEDLEALIKKGNEAFEKAEYEKAMKIYEKGLKASPKEAVLFYNKANVLQRLGKSEEALEIYKEAIKNNPKKVLLKNIYFNEGNALYILAKDKSSKEGAGIEELKEALGRYEKAFDKYRKSLELERKISIANGTDIHKAGIYAKQNWALARDAWTKNWERIREIEKKNLKLEDGIQNLLQAQNDLLPRLESVYLYSFSEDSLKFNLKTLAQYQIDYQEDILHLQEIAQKDVDRVFAELENYKAAQNKDDKKANMGGDKDPELAKLKKAHEDVLSVQRAVDAGAGLEGWIIDGLKRSDPVGAWGNSRSLISLLYDIVDYLKKSDHVKNIYTLVIKEFHGADRLLSGIDQISFSDNKGKDIKSKTVILGAAKLDAGAQDLLRINKELETLQSELEKQVDSPLSYAHGKKDDSGVTPGISQPDPAKPDQVKPDKGEDDLSKIFERILREITVESTKEVISQNKRILAKLEKKSAGLKEKKSAAGAPELEPLIRETLLAMVGYENIQVSLFTLFASMVKTSEAAIDRLEEMRKSDFDDNSKIDNTFADSFVLMGQLFFKYKVFIDRVKKENNGNLKVLAENLPQYYSSLESSWNDFKSSGKNSFKNRDDVSNFEIKVSTLRQELLKSMVMLAPDTAISLYFERVKTLQSKVIEALPSTSKNSPDIQKRYGKIGNQLEGISSLLSQYFKSFEKGIGKIPDKEKKEPLLSKLQSRKKAQTLLDRGRSEIKDAYALVEKGKFLKNDLLAKDLVTTTDKAHLAFFEGPKDAQKALEASITWQTLLKEQSRQGAAIETIEGDSGSIVKYLTGNQTDISDTAGLASRKIRETMEKASKGDAKAKTAPGTKTVPGLIPPGATMGQSAQMGQADPKKMKEAIKYIQDALIETKKISAFLSAKEFHNTDKKHDQVIELFKKALETLKSDQEGSCDNKDQDKKGSDDKQKDDQKKDQQNQQGQSKKQQPKPLELTPQQARELLNRLNKQDTRGKQKEGKRAIDTPRPW